MTRRRGKRVRRKLIPYMDQDRNIITTAEFNTLREDKGYKWPFKFENKLTLVQVEWVGRERDAARKGFEYWNPFVVRTFNKLAQKDGTVKVVEDHALTRSAKTRGSAESIYKELVAQYTESYVDDVGELVEVGNIIEPPPPPPAPDAPKTTSDEAGCW